MLLLLLLLFVVTDLEQSCCINSNKGVKHFNKLTCLYMTLHRGTLLTTSCQINGIVISYWMVQHVNICHGDCLWHLFVFMRKHIACINNEMFECSTYKDCCGTLENYCNQRILELTKNVRSKSTKNNKPFLFWGLSR